MQLGGLGPAGLRFVQLCELFQGCPELESVDLFFNPTIDSDVLLGPRPVQLPQPLVELPSTNKLRKLVLRFRKIEGAGYIANKRGQCPALNRYAARWKERKGEGAARGETGWARSLECDL